MHAHNPTEPKLVANKNGNKKYEKRVSFLDLFICSILVLTLLSTGEGIVAAADPIISIKPTVKDVNMD